MNQSSLKIWCPSFLLMISITAFCIFFSSTGHTKEVVSARYVSITKNQIDFEVNVGRPAPANLIVQHFYPAQNQLLRTIPQASKVDRDTGTVKWFLKSVKPGKLNFTLSFNTVESEKGIKAILRYRDPVTGNFIETVVFP